MAKPKLFRSNSTKVAALQLKRPGIKAKVICESLTIPKTTLNNWIDQAKKEGTFDAPGMARLVPRKKNPRSGSNRRKVLDETKKKMKNMVKKNPFMTASELKLAIPELSDVSNNRILYVLLHDLGLNSRVAAKTPMITDANQKKIDDWANKHASWGKKLWNKLLFSDKSHIEIWQDSVRSRKVCRSVEDGRNDPKFCRSTIKHPLKLMVWASVGGGKLDDIVVVPNEDDCDDGGCKKGPKCQKRVNQDVYIDILNKNFTDLSGRLDAPSSCKMEYHATQARKSSNGLLIILGSPSFCGLHSLLI